MAQITPQLVKELREKTGAGMGDCKKALTESGGDMKEAVEYLRKKGAASAAKRADRSANEGLIIAKTTDDHRKASIVEVNCETDFVARNEEFEQYVEYIAEALLENKAANLDELMNISHKGDTVQGMHNEILAKLAENIQVRRFETLEGGFFTAYIHAGSKLAVLLEVNAAEFSEEGIAKLRDIAMQIAAMNPLYIDRDSVPKEVVEKEKEIYVELAVNEGKKPEIADKIAMGRLNKFYQENCLVEQVFVKDPKKVVNDILKELKEDAGEEVKILSFRRYFLGESLED